MRIDTQCHGALLGAMDAAGVDFALISCNIPDPGLLPKECTPRLAG